MNRGAITDYIDVAQVALYVFWMFFAGLILYLRREDKREGYPLESDRSGRVLVQGLPGMPTPKAFKLHDGSVVYAPSEYRDTRVIKATPIGPYPGAPLEPTGNPMLDGVGPAAFAERANHPDYTIDGLPMIVPSRLAPGYGVSSKDPNPIGMDVCGADRVVGGVVTDIWVDRAEPQIRYIELKATGGRQVLLPFTFAKFDAGRRRVNVRSILGAQFATVPGTAHPDQVTRREEDQIQAYYAGGNLYATAARAEPLL
jgi:photosynthetic reaction center H subunit